MRSRGLFSALLGFWPDRFRKSANKSSVVPNASRQVLTQAWLKTKAGERVRFQSGTVYERQLDGSIRRVHPIKPWTNKAEHRRYKKQRRMMRAEMAGGSL